MKQVISEAVTKIYQHLENLINSNADYQLTKLESLTVSNRKLGELKMTINAVISDCVIQGRLSAFYINNMIVGMMFYHLPNPKSKSILMGTDIMSSGYALSLVCIELNVLMRNDEKNQQHLIKLKKSILEHAVLRKTPPNFINIFHPNHIIVGVKKNHEKAVADMIISHHNKVFNNHDSLACKLNQYLSPQEKLIHSSRWIMAMKNNIKETKYWEKVFGINKTSYLLEEVIFPDID